MVVYCVVDFRCGTNAGKEHHTGWHFGTGDTAATDGKSSSYTNTLRPLSR